MRFGEVALYSAVADVYDEIQKESRIAECTTPSVRSEQWLLDDDRRRQLTQRIVLKMTDGDSDILAAFVKYAKAPRNGAEIPKLHLTIQVARLRGSRCFYSMLGNCSDDVELDRIKPGSDGGEYTLANCVIACGKHNRERQDKSVTDFLNGST